MDALIEHRTVQRVVATLGVIATLALAFLYILMPMLVVPYPVVYGYWVAWGVLVLLSLVWWSRHPWRSFLVPIVGLVLVLAAITLGELLFGWTA